METWIPLHGFEKFYECSDTGKIKSLYTGRLMKLPVINNKQTVRLFVKGKYFTKCVSKLMLQSFGKFSDDMIVYKDGNSLNDSIDNLFMEIEFYKHDVMLHYNLGSFSTQIAKDLGLRYQLVKRIVEKYK